MASSPNQQQIVQGIPITVTRIEFHFAPVFIPAGQEATAPANGIPHFPFFGMSFPQFLVPNGG